MDWGNVRQLDKANRLSPTALTERAPLLPGAETVAFLGVDSSQRRVFGPAKQDAAFGHTKITEKSLLVRGLNALVTTLSTLQAAPVIAGTRLRGGNAGSARGATSFVAEAITTARHAGATGTLIVRADSAYCSGTFVAACHRAGARFSVTWRSHGPGRA
ncbi:transposase [Parafrankia elaeagni]|uniref:transposase n=1 Tax=Parafrankia elaeagni TaxID=222534 RepID=UPI0003752F8F|nr:transposase [Parafrankia elaeagni]